MAACELLTSAGRRARIALVHEWFDAYYGSERVTAQILRCFPDADVFTLVDVMAQEQRGFLAGHRVHTSFLQRLPFARRHFRLYLPLMPLAIEQFDLAGYDLVLSSSHAFAKGVLTGPAQCTSPTSMRRCATGGNTSTSTCSRAGSGVGCAVR